MIDEPSGERDVEPCDCIECRMARADRAIAERHAETEAATACDDLITATLERRA